MLILIMKLTNKEMVDGCPMIMILIDGLIGFVIVMILIDRDAD